MTDSENDILERLRHPEREQLRRRKSDNLFLRNILNGVFMLMAATTIVGLLVTWQSPTQPVWCYVLGLLAVVVKMVEALLRMPGMKQEPRRSHFANSQNDMGEPESNIEKSISNMGNPKKDIDKPIKDIDGTT